MPLLYWAVWRNFRIPDIMEIRKMSDFQCKKTSTFGWTSSFILIINYVHAALISHFSPTSSINAYICFLLNISEKIIFLYFDEQWKNSRTRSIITRIYLFCIITVKISLRLSIHSTFPCKSKKTQVLIDSPTLGLHCYKNWTIRCSHIIKALLNPSHSFLKSYTEYIEKRWPEYFARDCIYVCCKPSRHSQNYRIIISTLIFYNKAF